mmetsp:Transcript_9325/g.13807  ORF Transcript_9325/g.13807 Transcript_9325/m.13807 type:complete len:135 (+) Transcript_9325:171-575(+)
MNPDQQQLIWQQQMYLLSQQAQQAQQQFQLNTSGLQIDSARNQQRSPNKKRRGSFTEKYSPLNSPGSPLSGDESEEELFDRRGNSIDLSGIVKKNRSMSPGSAGPSPNNSRGSSPTIAKKKKKASMYTLDERRK